MPDDPRLPPRQPLPDPFQPDDPPGSALHFRSIWISDIHLGTRGCQAGMLLDFLRHTESDYLYLVGDIVDGWQLKKRWFWPQAHNDVVQKILRRARKGSRVFFVAGNHDEFARDFCGLQFGGVLVTDEVVHETAGGQRLLVVHGDRFDAVMNYARWLAYLGDAAYDLALLLNRVFNYARRKMGFSYWSLSAYLKHKVKNAVAHIGAFEHFLAEEARRKGADGVVCGHIHHAEIRMIGPVIYCNDGDWVESCTALVEDAEGNLSIVRWADDRERLLAARKEPAIA
ncbi:MAG TPA: UDP-2,3-diacylglucosamine diphosphatase [Alphaproteobacteria bacterium]|nr:UDP-2,3-diacylglucosamine diphosphatase [Alphaproteobacteria bacterium]